MGMDVVLGFITDIGLSAVKDKIKGAAMEAVARKRLMEFLERQHKLNFNCTILKIDLSNYGYARHYKFLKDSYTVVPYIGISELFNKKVSPMYKQITHNVFENIELTRLRDWLLPMLMNGQATVEYKEDSV